MRARKTSPALICRSEAPRWTAALMIFSIISDPSRLLRLDRSLYPGWKQSHAVSDLLHRSGGHPPGAGGAIAQDLLDPVGVPLKLKRALPDGVEGSDHIIG